MLNLLKLLLKKWNDQVNCGTMEEKMRVKTKITKATFTQTRVYLKPLLKKLKNNKIPDDIFDSLTEIFKKLLQRDYIKAADAYLTMAIGNAPWPIGVTMVGIHARTGREKIFSKNVAHVLNDETQRKYIQGLKRLMTKCQEFYPAAPSKSVEYVSHRDAALGFY
jgi:pre-mRNA-splicing factor 18